MRQSHRRACALSLLLLAPFGCAETRAEGASGPFDPIPCPASAPDGLEERLCAEASDPEDAAPDDIDTDCALESACFAPADPELPEELLAMTYNLERGFLLDEQLALFESRTVPRPDVLLVSEADRGYSRTEGRNVRRELAQANELMDHAEQLPHGALIAGDTNAITYHLTLGPDTADPTVRAFLDRDWLDTHIGLPADERATTPAGGGAVIDLIFSRGLETSAPGLCPIETCATLSDHVPVWVKVGRP